MVKASSWKPPGKNCGLCGARDCDDFLRSVSNQEKEFSDCPFFSEAEPRGRALEAIHAEHDILGNNYDFILSPLPGEVSARKIVLPFRGDLVEKMEIQAGDLVVGRPMGAGCPIPHVLKVQKAEIITGLLYTWVVGPKFSREREVKDVVAYHMIGFEGVADYCAKPPAIGCRTTFLPGFCMMNLNHTGLVNMVLAKQYGWHVRIEDIRILAKG